ncbi:flagellar motor switch protein FliM [Mycetocola miduiensis]|uniref:Flagellar motor switch protein FliM n=1 Tax=Mycetocola miduiensis TaxID=995034 RepID=A0A1I4YWK7_9MICO|nr:flagellar motor switch protein FliM [Mycetocola miduiensis]
MTVQKQALISVPAKPVSVYDFRRPTTLAREHSRVLELACETFARQWGTQLTAQVRAWSQVSFDQVQMQTYDTYAASLPATTAMVLCTLSGPSPKAVIQFPTSAALGWIDRMLGGTRGTTTPERRFTAVEQALVRQLMDDALDDLRYSFGALLGAPIAVDSIHYNSQFAQAAATNELMIVASFTIQVGEHSAPATVAIPAEALLGQLGETAPVDTPAEFSSMIRGQLTQVPVDVSVRLASADVRPGVILGLAVGDILPLPHPKHRPLDVTVGGQPLARAAMGAHGSRLACVVVETQENSR